MDLDTDLNQTKIFSYNLETTDIDTTKFALISLYSVSFILFIFSIINSTINNNQTLSIIEIFFCFLSISIIIHYKIYRNITLLLFSTTLLLFFIAIIFYTYSAKVLFSSIWLLFFPSVVFLLNGINLGKIYSFIYIITITTIIYNEIGKHTTLTGFLNLFIGLIFFTILAYIFEKNRLKSFNNIKNINQQLEKSLNENRTLLLENKRFIADSIHQIRTPLTNIMMNSEMIARTKNNNKSLCFIEQINASINMLTNSYEDLSYIISYDTINYNVTNVSISNLLIKRIGFFQTISKVNFKKIIYNITPNLNILINEVELERLIDNNISNAIKYATINKNINISLVIKEKTIYLKFKTYGEPINNPYQIFEINYRENQSKRGFGLGLNMVKNICDKYNIVYKTYYKNEQNIFLYTIKV